MTDVQSIGVAAPDFDDGSDSDEQEDDERF
jgi:hypothetical protein